MQNVNTGKLSILFYQRLFCLLYLEKFSFDSGPGLA